MFWDLTMKWGWILSKRKKLGIDVQFKVIPREVFDKKAVEKGQVKFYDVAYIEVKPIIRGRGNAKEVAIELTDFSVFYNQDNTGEVEEKLQSGGNKIIIENGQVIKISKDKNTDIIEREVLTKKWTDWIDYWSVDFDFESKKEIIRVAKEKPVQQKLMARLICADANNDLKKNGQEVIFLKTNGNLSEQKKTGRLS